MFYIFGTHKIIQSEHDQVTQIHQEVNNKAISLYLKRIYIKAVLKSQLLPLSVINSEHESVELK